MDEATPASAARRRARRCGARPTTPSRDCAGCRSPTSATPGSTTTARCARACPRRSTARARRPSSAPASSASCSTTATGRCCSPGLDDEQAKAVLAAHPDGRAPGRRDRCGGRPDRARRRAGRRLQRRHGRRAGGRRVRGRPCGPTGSSRRGSTTSASPACIACSPTTTTIVDRRRGRRRRRHGGRAGQRRRRADAAPGRRRADEHRLRRRRSTGSPRCSAMLAVVRLGGDRRRHRQRVRRGVRRRPDARHAAGVTRVAWFHCFNGVAGDMALGALLDAGADARRRSALDRPRSAIDGWSLQMQRTQRVRHRGDAGARDHRPTRRPSPLRRDPSACSVAPRRSDGRSGRVRRAGRGRRRDPRRATRRGRVPRGRLARRDRRRRRRRAPRSSRSASTRSAAARSPSARHGPRRPRRAAEPGAGGRRPARPRGAPGSAASTIDLELTTPTGAALMTVARQRRSGRCRPWSSTASATAPARGTCRPAERRPGGDRRRRCAMSAITAGQPVRLLEANVDDVTGEVLAHTVAALLAAGAHDAWITPIVMKKGRPAHTVHALCDPALAAAVARRARPRDGHARRPRRAARPLAAATDRLDRRGRGPPIYG